MRIRTIKPEFYLHEGLFELERESKLPIRLAFTGLWCVADREGRFRWEPRKIGVQILPYDAIDFSRVLDALTTRGFIVRYASNEGLFGYIPSFKRHQVINNRESDSKLPNPSDCNESDACGTRDPRDDDGNDATKSGREGKGREGKGVPPNPQGGMEGGELELETEESKPKTILPKNWEKMSATEQKRNRVNLNSPIMNRIGKMLGRREGTLWTVAEALALKAVNPQESEIAEMDGYYLAEIEKEQDYRRRDLLTLLNNWNGELDRARIFNNQ